MSDILDEIVTNTRDRIARSKAATDTTMLRAMPAYNATRRGFVDALRAPGISIIAEHKRRSPSKGTIREDMTLRDIVLAYGRGGAAAVSVLTEPDYFGGSLDDLASAREHSSLPLLRKDFIVDEYQLHEARAWGADAVLLIAAALEPSNLNDLHAAARDLGLDVLVEVHEPEELEGLDLQKIRMIGVNNRDLRTFTVDLATSETIFPLLPAHTLRVSESGFHTADDVRFAGKIGADAVLVGERLMRDADPAQLITQWLNAGVEVLGQPK